MSSFYDKLKCIEESLNAKDVETHLPYSENEFTMVDDYEGFIEALKGANKKRTDDSFQLYIPTTQEAKDILDNGGKLFMSSDGKAGGYVKHDGYIGGIFKDPTANRKGAAKAILNLLIREGGYFFDAFATHLEDIYIKSGFRPVVRMDFDERLAPKGWESSNLKQKPDNVFFVYDPSYKAEKGEGERNNNFVEAYEIAKSFK